MSESICATCAKGAIGCTSCCISPFIGKDPGFWMTLSDVAKIVNKTKLNPEEFCRFTEVDDDELEEDEDLDDRHSELMEYNEKIILMNGQNKCFFLGKQGCRIFEDRPKMCQLYPFWFKETKKGIKITVQQEDKIEEDDCLITKSNYGNKDVKYLLKTMNETEENMRKITEEYIQEMELHSKHKKNLGKKSMIEILKEGNLIDKNLEVKKLSEEERKIALTVIN
ncbi:YkgJ family cysteine cluster protein [Candidatus Woesearchaeota archaeon]|nr:YkgJ family cysteine cluster protein [Candidatus Woesearchaeota archaeon]